MYIEGGYVIVVKVLDSIFISHV